MYIVVEPDYAADLSVPIYWTVAETQKKERSAPLPCTVYFDRMAIERERGR